MIFFRCSLVRHSFRHGQTASESARAAASVRPDPVLARDPFLRSPSSPLSHVLVGTGHPDCPASPLRPLARVDHPAAALPLATRRERPEDGGADAHHAVVADGGDPAAAAADVDERRSPVGRGPVSDGGGSGRGHDDPSLGSRCGLIRSIEHAHTKDQRAERADVTTGSVSSAHTHSCYRHAFNIILNRMDVLWEPTRNTDRTSTADSFLCVH